MPKLPKILFGAVTLAATHTAASAAFRPSAYDNPQDAAARKDELEQQVDETVSRVEELYEQLSNPEMATALQGGDPTLNMDEVQQHIVTQLGEALHIYGITPPRTVVSQSQPKTPAEVRQAVSLVGTLYQKLSQLPDSANLELSQLKRVQEHIVNLLEDALQNIGRTRTGPSYPNPQGPLNPTLQRQPGSPAAPRRQTETPATKAAAAPAEPSLLSTRKAIDALAKQTREAETAADEAKKAFDAAAKLEKQLRDMRKRCDELAAHAEKAMTDLIVKLPKEFISTELFEVRKRTEEIKTENDNQRLLEEKDVHSIKALKAIKRVSEVSEAAKAIATNVGAKACTFGTDCYNAAKEYLNKEKLD